MGDKAVGLPTFQPSPVGNRWCVFTIVFLCRFRMAFKGKSCAVFPAPDLAGTRGEEHATGGKEKGT